MDLIRHLQCFVAVAEERHFGRAAELLGMAQPPLSQRIQRLERELGVRLFERTSRQVTITAAGTMLLEDARLLLARADALAATARRIRDGESGLLRAALPPDLAGEAIAAILAAFRQHHPGVELELHELSTAEQLARFASRELDVGLVRHPCDLAGLELGPVLRRELGVLLPRQAPAATLDEVPLAALTGHVRYGDHTLVLERTGSTLCQKPLETASFRPLATALLQPVLPSPDRRARLRQARPPESVRPARRRRLPLRSRPPSLGPSPPRASWTIGRLGAELGPDLRLYLGGRGFSNSFTKSGEPIKTPRIWVHRSAAGRLTPRPSCETGAAPFACAGFAAKNLHTRTYAEHSAPCIR
ncbi:LysR family transcriptional regulator [Streptomyces sp. KS 21]|uniref:LysR family transcriptional regulator n=1 Tax=Streptomyces sp. KS 21 TaxID=2485150 RepID=UPI0010633A86|nr:LysR family transcriptional regulator [Streptomyces sp. KS 21]TDU74214.1 LysR substrate binding domain-containing protein [Streptomyces sp. KS 21]